MKSIGVGIIGAGVGSRQAPGFLNHRLISHIVLCDTNRPRLEAAAAKLKITDTTADWRELIKREDLGLISVASPDHLHLEMVLAALGSGKHVLCEKPMAMNLAEARQIIAAVDRSGRKLMVNNVLRFYPCFRRLKQLVDEGMLGTIYAAEGDYLHNTLHLIRGGWRGRHRHSVMTGGGVHLLDLLRWMVGEIDQAFCYATRGIATEQESLSPDCMLAILRFKNGAIGKSMTNMALQKPAGHNFILYGTKGVFISDGPDGWLYSGHDGERQRITATDPSMTTVEGNKTVAVQHLLECIEHDRTPMVNAREGARTLAVCDAINESYQTGMPVDVQSL